MTVTVAVPSVGGNSRLAGCLRSILTALDQLPDGTGEAILVLNGPDADNAHPGIDDSRLRVITDPVAGAARARNTALDLAVNDRVLFTDDDCQAPADWCRTLAAALETAPAVAAPVVVPHGGPVASFLDYKRTFVAPPVDATTVRCMVTANCGMRRSTLPDGLRFDDLLFDQAAAEDSALSYQLADAGLPIRWVDWAAPVEHHVRDAPREIVQRFLRYGRANARLVNAQARWQESVPEAWSWFTSIRRGLWNDHRHFTELPAPTRPVFVAFELALTVSWLIGYLEEMQHHLGLRVVSVDWVVLIAALETSVGRAAGAVAADRPWTAPIVDVTRLAAPDGLGYTDKRVEVSEALHGAVEVVGSAAGARMLADHLAAHSEPVRREQARIRTQALDAWTRIVAAGLPTVDQLETRLRRAGVSLSDGLDEIEKAFSAHRAV